MWIHKGCMLTDRLWTCKTCTYSFVYRICVYAYYSCIMNPSDLPDMYTQASGPQGPQARGQGCIYQANHEGTRYNWYVPCKLITHSIGDRPLNSLHRPTCEIRLWNSKNYFITTFLNMTNSILEKFYLVAILQVFKSCCVVLQHLLIIYRLTLL